MDVSRQNGSDWRTRFGTVFRMTTHSPDAPETTPTSESVEPTYDVVWPQAPAGAQPQRLAATPTTLTHKRVAFIWDYMFRGEELFPVLEQVLRKRFDGLEVVGYDKFGNIHGPNERAVVQDLPDQLRRHRIDVAVVGNGC
jgi:hypothetical protein